MDKKLGMKSYFCKPYHSWEKGNVENRNGILRRYFSKKRDWALTGQKERNNVVDRINSMPMKRLGYKTPGEVFPEAGGVAPSNKKPATKRPAKDGGAGFLIQSYIKLIIILSANPIMTLYVLDLLN
jgi:hypothetical protein